MENWTRLDSWGANCAFSVSYLKVGMKWGGINPLHSLAERFPRHPRWQRFFDRWEPIDEKLVHSFTAAEFLWHWGNSLLARSESMRQILDSAAMLTYGLQARDILHKLRPDVYHYRCCFGLWSVDLAKRLRAVGLCD